MGAVVNAGAVLIAALSVGGYLIAGEAAVVAVVLVGVMGLTWRVAVTSRPRPPRAARQERNAPRPLPDGRWAGPSGGRSGARRGRTEGAGGSGVLIGHQGDADVVHDEGRQRQ